MSEERRFYVYAYLRSRDSKNGKEGSPYYVGKGKDDRAYRRQHRVKPPTDKKNIVFLGWGLTEGQAFAAEKHYIRYYGRIDQSRGCLRNLSDGGEGASGLVHTEEARRKMSEDRKGKTREPLSYETRRKIGEANRGRKRSEETRRKLRERKLSEETRRKMSEAKRNQSAETRSRISLANKGRKKKPEHIAPTTSRYWLVTFPDGSEVVIENMNEFSRTNGLCAHSMGEISRGRLKQHKGFKAKKLENPPHAELQAA